MYVQEIQGLECQARKQAGSEPKRWIRQRTWRTALIVPLQNRVLKAQGLRIYGVRCTVESVAAPLVVAKMLELPEGAPLLLVTSVFWDKDMQPFEYYTYWVRTDVVKVTVVASASPKGG